MRPEPFPSHSYLLCFTKKIPNLPDQIKSMALLENQLKIKKSILPGAGKGIFTAIDIPAKAIIVEYRGKLVKWKDVKDEDGYNPYIFKISSRWAVDALHDKDVIGRYANDARGFARAEGMRNNCEYIVKGKKVYIASTRKIHKGSEIYVDYGRSFWSLLSRLMKLPDYEKRCRQVKKRF